jgi:hypothetical protein
MLNFLSQLPSFTLFILLSCASIITSFVSIFLIRRFVPLQMQYKDNAVIGNISALISIIYGVLAGLIALYLINNISYSAEAVQNEVIAVANLYRDSNWLKKPAQTGIHKEIKRYISNAIDYEWPAMMNAHHINDTGAIIINTLSQELSKYSISGSAETIIVSSMVNEIHDLSDAREQRIRMSYSEINTETWVVILLGTILTIAINYLFGMNLYFHLLTSCATAIMASSMVFLLLTLDRPFQGSFLVGPNGFKTILAMIEPSVNTNNPDKANIAQ